MKQGKLNWMKAILEDAGSAEKREEGLLEKTIVFGLKQRKGKVYAQVIKNCSKTAILPLITAKIGTKATVFTDGFKTYDRLSQFRLQKTLQSLSWKERICKKRGQD